MPAGWSPDSTSTSSPPLPLDSKSLRGHNGAHASSQGYETLVASGIHPTSRGPRRGLSHRRRRRRRRRPREPLLWCAAAAGVPSHAPTASSSGACRGGRARACPPNRLRAAGQASLGAMPNSGRCSGRGIGKPRPWHDWGNRLLRQLEAKGPQAGLVRQVLRAGRPDADGILDAGRPVPGTPRPSGGCWAMGPAWQRKRRWSRRASAPTPPP